MLKKYLHYIKDSSELKAAFDTFIDPSNNDSNYNDNYNYEGPVNERAIIWYNTLTYLDERYIFHHSESYSGYGPVGASSYNMIYYFVAVDNPNKFIISRWGLPDEGGDINFYDTLTDEERYIDTNEVVIDYPTTYQQHQDFERYTEAIKLHISEDEYEIFEYQNISAFRSSFCWISTTEANHIIDSDRNLNPNSDNWSIYLYNKNDEENGNWIDNYEVIINENKKNSKNFIDAILIDGELFELDKTKNPIYSNYVWVSNTDSNRYFETYDEYPMGSGYLYDINEPDDYDYIYSYEYSIKYNKEKLNSFIKEYYKDAIIDYSESQYLDTSILGTVESIYLFGEEYIFSGLDSHNFYIWKNKNDETDWLDTGITRNPSDYTSIYYKGVMYMRYEGKEYYQNIIPTIQVEEVLNINYDVPWVSLSADTLEVTYNKKESEYDIVCTTDGGGSYPNYILKIIVNNLTLTKLNNGNIIVVFKNYGTGKGYYNPDTNKIVLKNKLGGYYVDFTITSIIDETHIEITGRYFYGTRDYIPGIDDENQNTGGSGGSGGHNK